MDMSVIVPVYNTRRYVERCVHSLDAQMTRGSSFEVILVDDGSTDGSREVCERLVAARPNYTFVRQENRGVSCARNVGMRSARGRYLMFLDSDDTISSSTIDRLVTAFDRFGDAVDLLTYPLVYVDELDGYAHTNVRYQWLKSTGVYDLAEQPFVAQTSINVCLRNLGEKTPRFDERYSHSEDQLFITHLLSQKNALGFCAHAQYRYHRVPTSTTMLRDRPYASFDDVMSVFEEYVSLAQQKPPFARYAYALLLYNVSWRLREHKLLPDFGDADERERNHQRLAKVMRSIPKESWLESPFVTSGQRDYLASVFGLEWAKGEAPASVLCAIDWMTYDADALVVKGLLQIPMALRGESPHLHVEVDGEASTTSLLATCSDGWRFELSIPVAPGVRKVARLFVGGMSVGLIPLSIRLSLARTNGRLVSAHIRWFGNTVVSFGGNTLRIGSVRNLPPWVTPAAVWLARAKDRRYVPSSSRRLERQVRARLSKQAVTGGSARVWVYSDSLTSSVRGLAYDVFERDRKTDDGVMRVYITEDWGLMERLEAFMKAERVFSSCTGPDGPYPCGMRLWSCIADLAPHQTFTLVTNERVSLEGTCYDDVRVMYRCYDISNDTAASKTIRTRLSEY